MKKVVGGRPKDDDVWRHVVVLEEGRRWKCKYCKLEFAGGATRIRSHIKGGKGGGIRACAKYVPDRGNSNDLRDNLRHCHQVDGIIDYSMPNEAGQSQADAKYQKGVRVVGSSSVSDGETEDLKVIQYVFECLSPEDKVFGSPLSYLTQEEFATLRPGAFLDSLVIDAFAEMLTHIERKKKITPSNCYLPVTFSEAALKYSIARFLDFVDRQKIRENYTSDLKSCEKLLAMEKLFIEVAFTEFRSKMETDILPQPNGEKEREDLAMKLLNSDLNQEKQSLYDKARRHYAQVGKQDGNKRLRVDGVNRQDRLEEGQIPAEATRQAMIQDGSSSASDSENENQQGKGSSTGYILPTTDLIGGRFQWEIKDIWEWIMDDKPSPIGIWGMAGSGKTALATHIHNKLISEEATSDIKVIWVTVSQNSISHLQKVVARSIELDISDEFEVKRIAGKLFQAFEEMNKCVIILDDVWDHFFLKDVGFPMSDNRIKLILTTRIWNVCQGMGCKKVIEVAPLDDDDDDDEESWDLFKEFLGSFREELSSEVEDIAQNVAQKCEGFPLAIVRIATSMKGRTEAREWRHMLECLENLGNGQYEMDKWVLPVLRSSYDFLNNKLQIFFLDCALSTNGIFDNDDANYLLRKFVYESIDETKKLTVQYNKGYNMLYKLKDHSMLDYDDQRNQWKINKFLRILAIGIAEETCKIMGKAYKNLTEIPSDDQWKEDLQKVFLTGNKIQTIPNGTCLKFSQLSTLLLNCNVELNHISDEFFNNMPVLKVLDLSGTGIKRLPESLSNLKCLIALLLSRCRELSCIPSLIKLKSLISLDLCFTPIIEAPRGLESLVNLRRLCLEVGWTQCSTDAIGQGTQGLKKLEVVLAYFRDISVFNNFVSFLAHNCVTRSYQLTLRVAEYVVGRHRIHHAYDREYSVKEIYIEDMDLGDEKVILPGGTNKLVIRNCRLGTGNGSLCSVLSYCDNSEPLKIELLEISHCKDLECLCCCNCPFCTDKEDLEDLVPSYADSLPQSPLFSHLTDLSISFCDSMEALITPKLLAHLRNLRTIDVDACQKMKEMVEAEKDHSELEPITLPELTSLKLNFMTQLDVVYRGIMVCPSLQTFSANNCPILRRPQITRSKGGPLLKMDEALLLYRWRANIDQSGPYLTSFILCL
ncbi:disease resistance protein At4g27190-like [Neltuma alba]|uniref:disease resistance protein At4g27190-like n=1 Tax=Neltuma alba TaxID=207710 RepID=UPI0010A4E7B9|nr:disease resistance protein At4g27190-like [Prosopis alba]